jgi:hypothetical protein
MATTIFTAKEYDPQKQRRRRQIILAVVSIAVIVFGLFYIFRYWPYEHRVDQFFSALESKDYKQAYAIWQNDSGWEQEFYRDWGPAGEWGMITSHKVEGAATPKGGSSGVVVVVTINQRVEPARLWVEKKDRTLTWSPY